MNFDEWFYKEFESKGKLTNDFGIKELMRATWNTSKVEAVKRILDLFKGDLERISNE